MNTLFNKLKALVFKKRTTITVMALLSSLCLSTISIGFAKDQADVIFESIKDIAGGSVTFVKNIEGHTYIGTRAGKLYQQDPHTKANNVISPIGINGINDLLLNNNVYFISTDQGLYLSKHNLDSWEAVENPQLMNQVIYMVIAHDNGLFAAAKDGIYKSEDNGSSWTLLDNTKDDTEESSRFIVSNGSQLVIGNYVNISGTDFLRYSDDDGKTWQITGESKEGNNYLIDNEVQRPITVMNNTFYVGAYVVPAKGNEYSALISSQDGKTWKEEHTFNDLPTFNLLAHDTDGRIYMGTDIILDKNNRSEPLSLEYPIYAGHPGSDDWKVIFNPQTTAVLLTGFEKQVLIGTPFGQVLAYDPENNKTPELSSTVTSAFINTMSVGDDIIYISASRAMTDPSSYEKCIDGSSLYIKHANGTTEISQHNFEQAVMDIDTNPGLVLTITCGGQMAFSTDKGANFTDIKSYLPHTEGGNSHVTYFNGDVYAAGGVDIVRISDYAAEHPKTKSVYKLAGPAEFINKLISTEAGLFATSNTKGVIHSKDGSFWRTFDHGLSNKTDIQTLAYRGGTLYGAYDGVYQTLINSSSSLAEYKWHNITNNLKTLTGNDTINRITVSDEQMIIVMTENGIYFAFLHDYNWNQVGKGLNLKFFVDVLFVDAKHFLLGTGTNGAYNGTIQ